MAVADYLLNKFKIFGQIFIFKLQVRKKPEKGMVLYVGMVLFLLLKIKSKGVLKKLLFPLRCVVNS